jgi:uncharacterized protein RhaS with RHS repeats
MTDAAGLTTTYTYDALGRTVCETRPGFCGALLITSNEYNTANQLVTTRTYSLEQPVLRSLGERGSSNSSPSPTKTSSRVGLLVRGKKSFGHVKTRR